MSDLTPSPKPKKGQKLLPGVSQFGVDFVIPRNGTDVPLGIDPFLLFKSQDERLRNLHERMVAEFNRGISLIREGRTDEAEYIFTVPEPREIGLGYGEGTRDGSGVGEFLAKCIIDAVSSSPALMESGIRHIEEMQLYSVGIGRDRTSDLACGFIKNHLIEYTQAQCAIWDIPLLKGMPVEGVYNFEEHRWEDTYADLPVSPVDGLAMLFVPRRLVRSLPFISYDDFLKDEMAAYLRAKRVKDKIAKTPPKPEKSRVVAENRAHAERVRQYVSRKEAEADKAQPSLGYLPDDETCAEAERLATLIRSILPGTKHANDYHNATLEILNFAFSPELADGEKEVRTVHGTERRDIVFTNESDRTFWSYVRAEHSAIFLMFEVKNVEDLSNDHVNQTATYLGDRLGRLGIILTRNAPSKERTLKLFSVYNDSTPRKVILVFDDADLAAILKLRCNGGDPMKYVQAKYRAFRTSVQ